MQYITKQQLREIRDSCYDIDEFHNKLEEYTGIQARSYVVYQYFDDCGNYIGDGEENSLEDLLNAAYIEVR